MAELFTKHRQPWKADEIAKLRLLAGKGKGLKEIAKALSRSEESTKDRAKTDGIGIAKLRCLTALQDCSAYFAECQQRADLGR